MSTNRAKYNDSYLYVNNKRHSTLDVYQDTSTGRLVTLDEHDDPKPLREGIILRNGLGHMLPYRKWEWANR